MNTNPTIKRKRPVTKGNFGRKLDAVKRSATTLRDSIQELLEFAFEQYRDHGDAGYLTRILVMANEVKALPAKSIQTYIQAHANVRLVKTEDGSLVFKKKGKKGVQVTPPDSPWYEFSKDQRAVPELDVVSRLESLARAILKAKETGERKIKGDRQEVKKLAEQLAELVA